MPIDNMLSCVETQRTCHYHIPIYRQPKLYRWRFSAEHFLKQFPPLSEGGLFSASAQRIFIRFFSMLANHPGCSKSDGDSFPACLRRQAVTGPILGGTSTIQSSQKMLREVIENADLVVVESPMHGALLIRDFKLDSRKVIAFGMGYEAGYLHNISLRASLLFPNDQ